VAEGEPLGSNILSVMQRTTATYSEGQSNRRRDSAASSPQRIISGRNRRHSGHAAKTCGASVDANDPKPS
jgi:hypothetical protein